MKTNQHRPDPKQGHQHLSCMANIGGRSMTSCERRTPRGRLRTTGGQRPHSFLFLREPPTINCTFFPLAANYIGPAWCYCLENIVVYIYIYTPCPSPFPNALHIVSICLRTTKERPVGPDGRRACAPTRWRGQKLWPGGSCRLCHTTDMFT